MYTIDTISALYKCFPSEHTVSTLNRNLCFILLFLHYKAAKKRFWKAPVSVIIFGNEKVSMSHQICMIFLSDHVETFHRLSRCHCAHYVECEHCLSYIWSVELLFLDFDFLDRVLVWIACENQIKWFDGQVTFYMDICSCLPFLNNWK